MINLRHRSYEKELMDADDIPFAAMARTLKELNIINTRLGGHAITIEGLRRLTGDAKHTLHVCEIGCGGGDNLAAIFNYCRKNSVDVIMTGIDLNAECIAYAKQQYPDLPCTWICSDYAKVEWNSDRPDMIFSSLFCHHFTDPQMLDMLQWLRRNSGTGFFINDLHRHWLAYFLIRYITKFFSRSYLVKHDACLSVARGFKRREWQQLLATTGIEHYHIRWRWAFRFLVTCKNS